MTKAIGGFPWDFDDAKIAANDGDGTFSTVTDVKNCTLVSLTVESRSGTHNGDGGKRELASKTIGVTGRMRFQGPQLDILAIVLGETQYETGTTPNEMEYLDFTGKHRPYFAVSARALSSEGGVGDTHLFAPRIKVMGNIELALEEENFMDIEFDFEGVFDDYVLRYGRPVCAAIFSHETAVAVAIPPTGSGYTTS